MSIDLWFLSEAYRCVDDDVGGRHVAQGMSHNRLQEMKRFFHLCDKDLIESSTYRMHEVRPLMNLLNKRFQQHGTFHRYLSVDDSVEKHIGHHPCKQLMRGKPIRPWYENWMLRSDGGYCYGFDIYRRKSANSDNKPLGSGVVLSLRKATFDRSDHIAIFKNVFTSHSLLVTLRVKTFRATGKLPEKRKMKCPFQAIKKTNKKDNFLL
ncbi:hypothetical protein HPB48_003340 [Haemaphysalis longicornis]|uniref:PiggyBac transposable element-derived protein domain-containing protein n=1 Tax=Haemaphysalis longicornis TaxID=44386 RepID=A0A9J6GTV0_HAELO|nr:hypothetical protein HPB48_003340 [Haemaphysalis longicornis]